MSGRGVKPGRSTPALPLAIANQSINKGGQMRILIGQAIVFFALGIIQGWILTDSYKDKQALRTLDSLKQRKSRR